MLTNKSIKSIIFAGSILATSAVSPGSALTNSQNIFEFSTLGSGAHVRATLLNESSQKNNSLELKCGNKSKEKTVKKEKSSESKCGEGKCGEKKATDSTKSDSLKTETHNKTKDAKCGEGKCGN